MALLYPPTESIEVGCSIIAKQGRILIAQRKPGTHLGGYWEFPGGKRRDGETIEECLIREVHEELGIQIEPRCLLSQTNYEYPDKNVSLHFYLCDWVTGRPMRRDCLDFKWVLPGQLRGFRFPLGDDAILNELVRKRVHYFGACPLH